MNINDVFKDVDTIDSLNENEVNALTDLIDLAIDTANKLRKTINGKPNNHKDMIENCESISA